ncbi:hypothetical protein B0A48_13362 [Cryoendolithus antarcticus]|uniref:TPR-like protein n=1 Tax=Cryoendolithus antarcticus TaxID=1507870 RepID=A0A1V8SPU5_9PEZI|nr:hypothetical protein B0A48_13362 [Cryoendolithus antarcticus]
MAAKVNGYTNGVNGTHHHTDSHRFTRFADVPAVIDIPVSGGDGDEVVNLDLSDLLDETDELCSLLENEAAAKTYWITIALAYAKQHKVDIAIDMIKQGLAAYERLRSKSEDKLSMLTCLVWLQLWRSRHTRRTRPEADSEDPRTKETFLTEATQTLNEASKISPSHPPLYLARGVLSLLRAALVTGQPGRGQGDRASHLGAAAKFFEDALRHSQGKSIMAMLGRAKALYSMGKFADALQLYQRALENAPDLVDPDPRIGIGCCLWALGHKEHAHTAWERSLELSPNSNIAHTLLGLHYLDQASQYSTADEAFGPLYKKAMTVHTQTAFKINDMQPLTCATFGGYFLLRKNWANVDKLAKRAVEQTDMTAIASDGWYLRARQAHYQDDVATAADCYNKSDLARGGDEKGYTPAKFGAAQLRTLNNDFDGAKFRLEKIVAQNRSIEAMTLLGILHAEEVFTSQASGGKEDKTTEQRKAIGLLEQVRSAWRDPKRKITPDSAVLLNLARLYEADGPEKSLQCLLQVEQMEIDDIPEDDRPEGIDDPEEERKAKRALISPQLLNNIGCFHFFGDRYAQAREDFQTALNACVKMQERDDPIDTDALVTTISFNLARTYEVENMDDEAKTVYTSLLQRHPDYIDASIRLSYIALNSEPAQGAKMLKQLMESDPSNLQLRSLYGWHVNRSKRRTLALNEDVEQKHYKSTLQTYDKHDLYSLTGMGNLHLQVAREMPRATDQEKDKRSGIYRRAVEFYDKVLTLDPRNAYAAQGMGIALAEDRKDLQNAIQILSKVRESIKDSSVYLNLGHIFVEVKQFGRSIENYELALAKTKSTDPQLSGVLACLGRTWLLRAKSEKLESRLEAMKTSLDYSRRALEASKGAKDEINHRFNVAFVQIQIAQLITTLPEAQRSLADVETASQDLDAAITSFQEIARSPHPPFPKGDIEARASMGRNTMKRQLTTAAEKQADYERKNASRLDDARKKREAEIQRREDEKRAVAEAVEERQRKVAEERQRMRDEDKELIARRMEEDRAKEEAEYTTDAETGEKKKREKRKAAKRKKKGEDDESGDGGIVASGEEAEEGAKKRRKKGRRSARESVEASGSGGEEGEGGAGRRRKKRRLERKSGRESKFKSADTVEESDEDDATAEANGNTGTDGEDKMSGVEEETVSKVKPRKSAARVVEDDDDEEDEDGEAAVPTPAAEEDTAVAAEE